MIKYASKRDWNEHPPTQNLNITATLKAHDDCEICQCNTCSEVWTGKELVVFSPDLEGRSSLDHTHCPRCGRDLRIEVIQHMRHCHVQAEDKKMEDKKMEDEKMEDESQDRLTSEARAVYQSTPVFFEKALESKDPNMIALGNLALINCLILQELNAIRLILKKE